MISNKVRQNGFGTVGIVIVVLALVMVAGIGYVVFKKTSDKKSSITTETTPSAKTPMSPPSQQPEQSKELEGMTQYTNDKYGFSFYYPKDWKVEERDPVASSFETDKTELSLWLVDTTAKVPTDTAIVNVNGADLDYFSHRIENEAKSYATKSTVDIDGKSAIKFSIPQGSKEASNKREIYFVAAGGKTYAISTTNEDANTKHAPDYATKFNKLVSSLSLP